MEFMFTFEELDPKIMHLDQVDVGRFEVNFYTNDGDEVGYGFTQNYGEKCLVLGCHDPRMYQPIPHKLMLNTFSLRKAKRVPIEFNGVVCDVGVTFCRFRKGSRIEGVAFTGREWERICSCLNFSSSKVLVISSDEYGGSFVAKMIDGFVCDINLPLIISGPGESSNSAADSENIFVIQYTSCADKQGYLCVPNSFHNHQIVGECRPVWLIAGGRSLYMVARIHIDRRQRSERNKSMQLMGEVRRLKEVLGLNVGDHICFKLVFGNINCDEALFFDVRKVV